MARTQVRGMKAFRKVRLEMNVRLEKALREGRLDKELAGIERVEKRRWDSRSTAAKGPREKARAVSKRKTGTEL